MTKTLQQVVFSMLLAVIGAAVLGLIFAIQKTTAGLRGALDGYLLPIVFGGIIGFTLGLWGFRLKQNQAKTQRFNLVLRAIRDVVQLLVHEKDRVKLLNGICERLVKNRGYHNAWIGLFNQTGNLMQTAEAGLGEKFEPMIAWLKGGKLTQCARRSLEQSDMVVIEDPFQTCNDCPLSENYVNRGAMSIRLEHNKKVYGILTVSVPNEFISDQNEHDLMEAVAGDIGYALNSIELEEENVRSQMEQQLAHAAIEESERRFRNLVENSLTGISIIQGGQIVYQNPEQERLLGPLPRPVKFEDIETIHPDDVEKVKTFYQESGTGDFAMQDTEFRFFPHGKKNIPKNMKWVHCRASRLEYQGKDALLLNMMDMTKTKELEHLLTIQDKMASLGRVAAGIAHEIRNPLSGINIYLNTLKKLHHQASSEQKVEQILGQIQSASRKIESVIRRVMDFAKPGEPKRKFIDINQPIRDAINLTAVTMRKSGITMDTVLADDLPPAYVDPNLIEETVLNLLNNAGEAMKTMETGKKIVVTSVVDNNNQIIIRVSDSGPGVSLDIRDKIFDPYFTTRSEGTGIGLSLSHRIITDHGGTLTVADSELGGAEFRIAIPIKRGKS
jgi:PAS domain S-box-containing protein